MEGPETGDELLLVHHQECRASRRLLESISHVENLNLSLIDLYDII